MTGLLSCLISLQSEYGYLIVDRTLENVANNANLNKLIKYPLRDLIYCLNNRK